MDEVKVRDVTWAQVVKVCHVRVVQCTARSTPLDRHLGGGRRPVRTSAGVLPVMVPHGRRLLGPGLRRGDDGGWLEDRGKAAAWSMLDSRLHGNDGVGRV